MKKRIFVLPKLLKRAEKIIFSLVFVCFRFTEISHFLSFPSNENVRKQHLFANAYGCVNMKFSYTIATGKDEIFTYCRIVTKTSDFCWCLGHLFFDHIYAKRWSFLLHYCESKPFFNFSLKIFIFFRYPSGNLIVES